MAAGDKGVCLPCTSILPRALSASTSLGLPATSRGAWPGPGRSPAAAPTLPVRGRLLLQAEPSLDMSSHQPRFLRPRGAPLGLEEEHT